MICRRCGKSFFPDKRDLRPYVYHWCDDIPLDELGVIHDNPLFWNKRRGEPGGGETRGKVVLRTYGRRVYDK